MYTDILSYEKHVNVAGGPDLLTKIYSFLNTRGWTIEYFGTDCDWVENPPSSGTYEVQSAQGTGIDRLQIRNNASIGYPNQDLRFFLSTYVHPSEGTVRLLDLRGVVPGQGAVNYSTATAAWSQFSLWGTSNNWYRLPFPSGTIPSVWLFGNDYFFACEVQVNTDSCGNFALGTPQLITEFQSTTEYQLRLMSHLWAGNTYDYPSNWTSTQDYSWNCFWLDKEDTKPHIYANGAERSTTRTQTQYWAASVSVVRNLTEHWVNTMKPSYESFSGRRTLVKPTCFSYDPSLPGIIPAGSMPVFAADTTGLNFGDELEYGSQSYLAFPTPFKGMKYGYCYRIA